MTFKEGKWDKVWFTYDEDDDCNRWERVELYQPRDPFKVGKNQGGIDNNGQADPAGDRGEWDEDNLRPQAVVCQPDRRQDPPVREPNGVLLAHRPECPLLSGNGGIDDGYGPKRI
ncbi:MAG: hypothetical protein ACLRS8_06770 [Parabacteroides merdae]